MGQESTIVLSRSLHDFVFRMSMTPSNNEYPKIQEKMHRDFYLRCILVPGLFLDVFLLPPVTNMYIQFMK